MQLVVHGQTLTELLEKSLPLLANSRDRSFCSELCYGFCRFYYVLQAELKNLLKKPLKSRDRDIQTILLLGLYQIRFMRVENYAAVNETVKLLQKRNKPWAKALVNGVLRSSIRKRSNDEVKVSAHLTKSEQRLAYPEWIWRKIELDWGEYSYNIFAAGNQHAAMVLRVNLSTMSRNDYLQLLAQHSIEGAAHPLVNQAVILKRALPVEQLPGLAKGWVSVQDAAAQIAAPLLETKPGMRVLDACSAPGGKTLHILQLTEDIKLTALDKDDNRLHRVRDNLNRADVSAQLICTDAAQVDHWFDGQLFERILLDVPCSASGIIRRHPDIRLLRKPEDMTRLLQLQQRLLSNLWPLLKPGGQLVYSTCSIFKDENENQIRKFMAIEASCVERPLNAVQWGEKRSPGRQIFPGNDQMDGFYYACLLKQM